MCGQSQSVCGDPDLIHSPQMHVCNVTAARTMWDRAWHRRYENVKPDKDGWHPTDGGLVWTHPELPPDPAFELI